MLLELHRACFATFFIKLSFQVLGLVLYPDLFEDPKITDDVKERARAILSGTRGCSVGSYTDSSGIEVIRKHVAAYIQERDNGIPADPDNIILSTGASGAIKNLLALFHAEHNGKKSGVMVPIPQYPLYSATITEFDMTQVDYYLDEDQKWGLDIKELERSVTEARKTCNPRVIVIINPGNPTGQVLARENIEDVIKFAHREKLFIFADEVYQDNVYEKEAKFHSFKKVLVEMGEPYKSMELASFMSVSKGYHGECGIRGGYAEILNMCPDVKAMLLKAISAQLCSSTIGQAAIDCVVNAPRKGEPAYDQFIKEKQGVLDSLKMRAEMVTKAFNSFEGFSCNPVAGAMYAFPQFKLPPKAIEAAEKAKQTPDTYYAFQLLERTGKGVMLETDFYIKSKPLFFAGICIVPGSGFGQRPGTYHFRTTILPQEDKLKEMLDMFQAFHKEFMAQHK